MKRKLLLALIVLIALSAAALPAAGYFGGVGPMRDLINVRMAGHPGNAPAYDPENTERLVSSPFSGKKVFFLGSSVTLGYGSMGVSVADYFGRYASCEIVKEAVSGTTLTESGNSYVKRLKETKEEAVDLFVCQLSTNDATKKKPLGKVSEGYALGDFDTKTVAGAIEYIIVFAKEKWDCPVAFYTNAYYDSENYAEMVALLHEIQKKWDITVIDLYSEEALNRISEEERALYMTDDIHPSKAGYRDWWLPFFVDALKK